VPDAAPAPAGGSRFANWFDDLPGDWRLTRRHDDGGSFEGSARFERTGPDAMSVTEEGVMVLPGGGGLAAQRRWLWVLAAPDTLEIHFDDGLRAGLYHRLKLVPVAGGWQAAAGHLCGADTYDGEYRFGGDRIDARLSITGPAKAMVLTGCYERCLPT
jgi:hypothetical protein